MSNQNVFIEKPLKPQSLFQKLFKSFPKDNSITEINNLFSKQEIKYIKIEDVHNIVSKYKINIYKKYKTELMSFYRLYLEYCLRDKYLSDNEISDLKHLKSLLYLNDLDVDGIQNDVCQVVYSNELQKVLDDRRIDEKEEDFLNKLANNLKLPKEITDNIMKNSATKMFKDYFDNAISDKRLSPDEDKEIHEIINNLGIDLKTDENTKNTLQKYRLFWQIENGNIPVAECDINLQKNEICHFVCKIEWLEQRKVTRRINYSGPALRIRIMRGVYWHAGSYDVQRVSDDVWKIIDKGILYLTNKRIIFMGSNGNKTINLKKILDFNSYTNGIDIQKDSGKSPFLQFYRDTDVFSVILGKLVTNLD